MMSKQITLITRKKIINDKVWRLTVHNVFYERTLKSYHKSRLCKRAEQVINDPYGALRVAGFPLLLYFHCPTTVYL